MELVKCKCGNESFTKRHYFVRDDEVVLQRADAGLPPLTETYYKHIHAMVCCKCGETLQWLRQDQVAGGF